MRVFTRVGLFSVGVIVAFTLASCGEGSLGGGTGEFQTVLVSAQTATTRLESDVLTGNTCSATGSTGGQFSTDSVDVKVTSDLYPRQTTGLNVAIDKVTVHFDPASTASPQLADFSISTIGTTIAPGSNVTISVPVAPEIFKSKLVNEKGLQLCSNALFEYFVTITFEGVELGTGARKGVTTSLNVAFADRSGA
jgi:hypothetical protein